MNNFERWQPYIEQYAKGTWRAPIFRDIILEEIRCFKQKGMSPVVLDIGCGKGFDDDQSLQNSIAEASGKYIGIEPDVQMPIAEHFSETHRTIFEEAPLAPDSVDIAFSVMVLEHISDPQLFWSKLHTILSDGGVFWGFTVDSRHPFVFFSLLMDKLGIKDRYLNRLRGSKGEERYENYKVYYRTNSPKAVRSFTANFSKVEILPFKCTEKFNFYLPKNLLWLGPFYSRLSKMLGLPQSIMIMRIEK